MRSISLRFSGLFLLAACAWAQVPPAVEPAVEPTLESPVESPVEPAVPVPAPATPVVTLESGWIAADESGANARIVDRPPADGPREHIYTARFHYRGDAPALGLRIVLPVPPGMRYIGGSATGPGAQLSYSVDGGRSFAPADDALPPEDYTHIRWDLPGRYAPGTRGLVSFRAIPRADGTASEDDMAPETT